MFPRPIPTAVAVAVVAMLSAAASAQEPQRLPDDTVRKYAGLLAGKVAELKELPFAVKLDTDGAMGIHAGGNGGALLLPVKDLNLDVVAKADGEPRPVGLVALHKLSLSVLSNALPVDKLHSVTITVENQEVTIPVLPIAVAKVAGRPVLLVYGKDKTPLVVTAMTESDHSNKTPLELDADGAGDKAAFAHIGVLGKWRATVVVRAAE